MMAIKPDGSLPSNDCTSSASVVVAELSPLRSRKVTAQYRVRHAVEVRGRPVRHGRLDVELAAPWAEQAQAELRAAGGRAARRGPATADLLSPQEMQIARLAAEGLSNREIGQRLYRSHRTVGSHLYRIFPKLDITSRSQLASRLDG